MNSDLLDEWCELEFGHTNWSMDADDEGNIIIKFFVKSREDYDSEENLEIDLDGGLSATNEQENQA